MGVILTEKYAHLIEKKGFDKLFHMGLSFFPLLKDVARSGKLRELSSFAIWEVKHTLGLYGKKSYLHFDDTKPLVLDEGSDIRRLDFTLLGKKPYQIAKTPHPWRVRFETSKGVLYGTLEDDNKTFYRSDDNGKTLQKHHHFDEMIMSLFVTKKQSIIVCTTGIVYRSEDGGVSFEEVLRLSNPGHHESYIFHINGFTQNNHGEIFMGEYGNVAKDGRWMNVANIYHSKDDGVHWQKSEFLKRYGVNKHVHMIKYSHLFKRVFLTDGDNLKKLWISSDDVGFDVNHDWKLVNRFHIQMGGFTSMTEQGDSLFLGTDYLGGTNFLVSTKDAKKFTKRLIPDPYRRSPLMSMVNRIGQTEEIWIVLHNPISSKTRCLLMCSLDGAKTFQRILEYDGTRFEVQLNSDATQPTQRVSFALTDKQKRYGVCYEVTSGGKIC